MFCFVFSRSVFFNVFCFVIIKIKNKIIYSYKDYKINEEIIDFKIFNYNFLKLMVLI